MADDQGRRPGTGSYIIAALSFIPGLGVLFGIAAIVIGLVKRKHGGTRLVVIGAVGLLFSVGLYGTLFYQGFVKRGGIYDDLRAQLAHRMLTDLSKSIEFYKITNGRYPDSLAELKDSLGKDSATFINDPTSMQVSGLTLGRPLQLFFYQLTEDRSHYYLLGVGPDQKPFTADDLLPPIPERDREKTGLLVNPGSRPASG